MTIVGIISSNAGSFPVYWTTASPTEQPAKLIVPSEYSKGEANGINNSGQIVGSLTLNSYVKELTDVEAELIANDVGKAARFEATLTPETSVAATSTITFEPIDGSNVYTVQSTKYIYGGKQVPVYWPAASPNVQPILLSVPSDYSEGVANGINNNGQIVGVLYSTNNALSVVLEDTVVKTKIVDQPFSTAGYLPQIVRNTTVPVPVYWPTASATSQPIPLTVPSDYSGGVAYGINNSGQIVGFLYSPFDYLKRLPSIVPVYWPAASPTAQPILLTIPSDYLGDGMAYGINDSGQITGMLVDTTRFAINGYKAAFSTIGAATTKVLSQYQASLPVYWSAASPTVQHTVLNVPSEYQIGAAAADINNSGEIVGAVSKLTRLELEVMLTSVMGMTNVAGIFSQEWMDISMIQANMAWLIQVTEMEPVYWSSSSPSAQPIVLAVPPGYYGMATGINDPPIIAVPNGIYLKSTFTYPDGSVYLWNTNPVYKNTILNNIANAAGVPVSNITLVSVKDGSLILTVYISGFVSVQYAINGCASLNNLPEYSSCEVITPTISNICFPSETPIKTDQGIVSINKLDTSYHTITGQPILHVTQTITLDPYLIRFEKDAIERNYPNKTTVMSKDHLIMYHDQLVPAYRFLDISSKVNKVNKVKYSGEILYNVLLAEYGTIEVNGLTCETLHPNNAVAKQFRLKSGFQMLNQKQPF